MITRRDLARALSAADVTDWVIVERAQEVASVDSVRRSRRNERRTRSTVVAHQDQPTGRGSVRLDVAAHDNAPQLVAHAVRLAMSALGPAWKTVPTAAPAKVDVFDRVLDRVDLVDSAVRVVSDLRLPPHAARDASRDVTIDSAVEVMREKVTVQSRAGLDSTWTATHLRAELLVVVGDHSLAIAREARKLADLELGAAVADAVADLEQLARATAPNPGPCAVVLGTDAMLPPDHPHGVWSIFATQADATLERQGLTRYRLGAPITAEAPTAPLPLTIWSDGALAHGPLSAPISDDGDAVRRFTIVDRGIATGLGLSSREAALRGKEPNGGVRNLVISRGTWTGDLPNRRVVEIRRLRALAIDPYTGDASLEIALGIDHDRGVQQPFTGGTVRLDLIAALAMAGRSTARVRRGSYVGPAKLLVESAELSA